MMTTMARHLSAHVVAIFQDNDRGHPVSTGSGLLIKHFGKPYLGTAAHVITEKLYPDTDQYFYSAPNTRQSIGGTSFALPKWIGPGTQQPMELDVVLYPLLNAPSGRLTLDGKRCLSSDHLNGAPPNRTAGNPLNQFLLTGYPSSRGEIKRHRNKFESELFSFWTHEADVSEYRRMNVNPHSHLMLSLDPKDLWREGQRVLPPKLIGCSGGPIWHLIDNSATADESEPRRPYVVALATDHLRSNKYAIAVRVDAIVHLLTEATKRSVIFSSTPK